MSRRLTAFQAGQLCASFMAGESFAALARRYRRSVVDVEAVVRRWQTRIKRARREGKR